MGSRQDSAAFHGRRLRSGGSRIQAGQAPQAHEHLDRAVACSNDDKEHVDAVQHLVTAELRDVHVARMRFYTDDKLEITGELLKDFQQLENQGECHIRSISAIKRAASRDDVKVALEGLEEAKSTWEPVSRVFHAAPAVLHEKLKALRLKADQKRTLVLPYRLRL